MERAGMIADDKLELIIPIPSQHDAVRQSSRWHALRSILADRTRCSTLILRMRAEGMRDMRECAPFLHVVGSLEENLLSVSIVFRRLRHLSVASPGSMLALSH